MGRRLNDRCRRTIERNIHIRAIPRSKLLDNADKCRSGTIPNEETAGTRSNEDRTVATVIDLNRRAMVEKEY